MAAIVLNGKGLAKRTELELAERVRKLQDQTQCPVPILATILVGEDAASATYVRMKGNACKRVGIQSQRIELATDTTTEALLDCINQLNLDPDVTGILLQHPVPEHINERACFDAISLEKDVDGVTSMGFGRMSMGEIAHSSATPAGIMRLLQHYDIPLEGKHAVVVGRSPILGKPMAMMLLSQNTTVTICHSRTQNLPSIIRQADIIVGALGRPEFIQGSWIAPGAVVIDAGYHPGNVGDIELSAIIDTCAAYTPVPGGVGPMTIATLIAQTLDAAERALLPLS